MIVKNEAHLIINTFKHLARFIKFDYWAINDNGSTDGTQDLIRGYFKEAGIPGVLDETPWQDFAFNRTVAFRAAFGKTDYAFVWDADDEIHGDFQLPEKLTADAYLFTYGNAFGARYSRCQLFKNSLRWKYVGVIHECPMSDEPGLQQIQERVEGDYYFVSGRTGARNRDPDKYLKDALILEKAFHEAVEKKDGILHRYAFYTAQSYSSCGRHEKSIEFYKKVLTLENWAQEKYMSCIEIYDQCVALKKEEEGLRYLVESFRYDSRRVEGIYRLIKYYCIHGPIEVALAYYTLIQNYLENEYAADNIATRLFAKKEEFDFYLPYYMVIVSERVKRYDIFKKMYEIIFRQGYLHAGAWWVHNLFHNLQFGIPVGDPAFVEAALTYVDKLRAHGVTLNPDHYEVLDRVVAASRPLLSASTEKVLSKKDTVRVMLTVTTCKRLALFKETMNSMLRTWRDISAVDYFFCVDDNSSAEDRLVMQTDYPFFDYYMKEPAEKGHRESMNIIWNKLREVQPTYWIHMEDDWLYFKQESYVSRGIALLEKYEDKNIHQLVFNREYGLMLKDMNRTSVEPLETGVVLHSQKEVQGPNCAYWPHYSIQPSIVRTRVILELGNYDSPNTFFERDYANKYGAAGYKTMFFDGIYSLHIGKQHWEKDGQNAYALNGIGQFGQSQNQNNEHPTLVITEIPKNEPLQGSMAEHLEQILEKITEGLPFGLIRPSDGEHKILSNTTLTNCDNWTFTAGGVLQAQLMSAIQTVDPNLYIGIPCNTCNAAWNCTQKIYDDFTLRWKVPVAQRTYANLFMTYTGWTTLIATLRTLKNGFYAITSGTRDTDLSIKERFIIDAKLVDNWDLSGESETERLLKFIDNKSGQLFCFSAGPLSKYWIPQCMKRNPNNMYVDVGAALDTFTKGFTNRLYTTPTSRFADSPCQFYPLNADLTGVSRPAINKNLVYMSVFFNAGYVELLRLLMQSIKFFSTTETIDFLVLTTPEFVPHINALSTTLQIPINIHLLKVTTAHEAGCARLYIFDYEHIASYDKILYIDTDIIVQNDLATLFHIELDDKLYALEESTIDKECWGGWFFDATADRSTPALNSGILLFKNTPLIRTLFADINSHIATMRASNATLPDCYDQPFINYHFIKSNAHETTLLKKYAVLMMHTPPPLPIGPTDVIFYHYAWPLGNAISKKQRMMRHLDHVFSHYTASPAASNPLINKKFSWSRAGMLHFKEADKVTTTWQDGTYKFLDSHTVCVSWFGTDHYLRMNKHYTEFISLRRGDYDCITGVEQKRKNLVYSAVYGDGKYVELMQILTLTMKFFSKTNMFEFLVLTSQELAPKILELSKKANIPIQIHIHPATNLQEILCARFTIFDYPAIDQYDRLLYLDTDIVIQGDLSPLFDQEIEDKIYALPEGTIEHEYHGGWFFDFTTIDKDTPGMNSGILLFKNTETIRSIFAAINAHSKKRRDAGEPMPSTGDQPFLNYHAIRGGHQDTQLLTKYALIYCMDPPPPPSAPTSIAICHFVWPLGDVRHKQIRMINHAKHVFGNYAAVTGATSVVGNPICGKHFRWATDGEIVFEPTRLRTTWANGEYKWLDAHTVEASWAGYEHILRFNDRYTGFISIRKKDFDCVLGIRV